MKKQSLERVEGKIGKISERTRRSFIELVKGTESRAYDKNQKFPILDPDSVGDNWVTSFRLLLPWLNIERLCLPLFGKENIVEGILSYKRPKAEDWVTERVGGDAFWEIKTHYRRPKGLDNGIVYDPFLMSFDKVLITDDPIVWIDEIYKNYKNKKIVLVVGEVEKALGELENYSWINGKEETIFRRKR